MHKINETHDINLTSWVSSALGHSEFPIQNLPFGIFKRTNSQERPRGGVAIGNQVIDLQAVANANLFDGAVQTALLAASQPSLNALMGLGQDINSALRLALSRALRAGSALQGALEQTLIPQQEVELHMPCEVGDFTDFYTSIHHATAVGSLFRPDNPLLPNYKWVPIGYHGRASTIGVSGQRFHRPMGQTKTAESSQPSYGPCKRLDYELEMGVFIGKRNNTGEPIFIQDAEQHMFGMCILNDWSARDIQAWEYQPLGPFLAKSFASTISPWVVTMEALAPYRQAFTRSKDDPSPLEYLSCEQNTQSGGIDITLECYIHTQSMRDNQHPMNRVSQSNFKHSYWTLAQLVTHHSSNGCRMNAGDLLGSGTQSGPELAQAGSLLELSKGGKSAVQLENGEERTFLQDGDSVIMRAYCKKEGAASIGFGEVTATILPAKTLC